MNTQHFDVLIIGAGLSGIGTACQVSAEFPHKTIAILERRERLGGTWDLFRYPGIRSDSDMLTFGYKLRPWHERKVLADGASIRQYIADTAAEYGVDEKIQYGLKIVARGLVERREPLDGHRSARGDRRDPPSTPAATSSAAPATTTTTPATCRASPASSGSRARRPSAALAGGPGLHGQEGRRDR